MPFKVGEEHIIQRRMLGYTVFRQVVPPSLLADLRRACAPAPEIARQSAVGLRAMRLTGVTRHHLDPKPFQDFFQLPALNEAIQFVLSPSHNTGNPDGMAILIETGDIPITQAWHRDAREEDLLEPDRPAFRQAVYDPIFVNQYNCPLYEDCALWFVPGSHLRPDLPSEVAACKSRILQGDDLSYEEREQRGVQYCKGMPGGVCLAMDAGDFALYHPVAWHLGSVLPYRKRLTLHDHPSSPTTRAWYSQWVAQKAAKRQADTAAKS